MANISNTFDFIWWALPRSASKSIWYILKLFDLERYNDDGDWLGFLGDYGMLVPKLSKNKIIPYSYSHHYHVPNWASSRVKDFGVIANVRNPYGKFWSWWVEDHMRLTERHVYKSFEDFVNEKYQQHYVDCPKKDRYQMFTNKAPRIIKEYKYPDYLIRYENLGESIRELPFIQQYKDHPKVIESLKIWIDTPYGGWRDIDKYSDEVKEANFKDYYTEELAEKVFKLHDKEFTLFNYEENSWK